MKKQETGRPANWCTVPVKVPVFAFKHIQYNYAFKAIFFIITWLGAILRASFSYRPLINIFIHMFEVMYIVQSTGGWPLDGGGWTVHKVHLLVPGTAACAWEIPKDLWQTATGKPRGGIPAGMPLINRRYSPPHPPPNCNVIQVFSCQVGDISISVGHTDCVCTVYTTFQEENYLINSCHY